MRTPGLVESYVSLREDGEISVRYFGGGKLRGGTIYTGQQSTDSYSRRATTWRGRTTPCLWRHALLGSFQASERTGNVELGAPRSPDRSVLARLSMAVANNVVYSRRRR